MGGDKMAMNAAAIAEAMKAVKSAKTPEEIAAATKLSEAVARQVSKDIAAAVFPQTADYVAKRQVADVAEKGRLDAAVAGQRAERDAARIALDEAKKRAEGAPGVAAYAEEAKKRQEQLTAAQTLLAETEARVKTVTANIVEMNGYADLFKVAMQTGDLTPEAAADKANAIKKLNEAIAGGKIGYRGIYDTTTDGKPAGKPTGKPGGPPVKAEGLIISDTVGQFGSVMEKAVAKFPKKMEGTLKSTVEIDGRVLGESMTEYAANLKSEEGN
jgi:hypothetical protein